MVHAFVMVTTAAGEADATRDTVAALPSVAEVHVVAGAYDLVVELDGEAVYDVLDTVATDIGHLDPVEDTRTYVSLN